MNRLVYLIVFLLFSGFVLSARSLESIPNVQVQNSSHYVSDPDNILSPVEIATADAVIDSMRTRSTVEVAVVIVKSLDDININDGATKLFNKWGIGDKNKKNGVLILIDTDNRGVEIRTGKGIEGVLPDVTCYHLIKDNLVEPFKQGRYGEGIIDLLNNISEIVTTPEAISELKATPSADSTDFMPFLTGYVLTALVVLLIMVFVVIYVYNTTKTLDRMQRYERLRKMSLPVLMISVFFLAIPIFAYFLLKTFMKRVRLNVPDCPNCQHKMHLIDEVHDNDFLTPAQDMEEKLNSVDYDVWLCDNCNATEVFPYINRQSNYQVCPICGARAETLESDVVLRQPSSTTEGIGQKQYYCKNCGNHRRKPYKIAKTPSAAPLIVAGGLGALGSRGGGGFSGGGFSGGGFGGGTTGGGGAGGSW